MKPTTEWESISPKQAREYLESNTSNRPLVERRVATLMTAIERGDWMENGDAIKFNGDGTLLDGQHRLAAIARGRKAVRTLVIRGLTSESQETMDIGASRTVGNMLAIRGHQWPNQKAAVARQLWTYERSGIVLASQAGINVDPTPAELIEIVESRTDIMDWIKFGASIRHADRSLGLTDTVVASLAIIFAGLSDEDDAKAFFNQLVTPAHQTDATAVLRKRLVQHGFHNPIAPKMRLALTIKAWNNWIAGDKPTRLTWRAGGAHQEPFPTPNRRPED